MSKKEKVTTLFIFANVDRAMEYYTRKEELGLTTEAECHELLMTMAREGKMDKVQQTHRTADQWLKDTRSKGFKIKDLRKKVE